jgi:hypothetical protein
MTRNMDRDGARMGVRIRIKFRDSVSSSIGLGL